MITIRQSEDRGYANHGWLKSYHTFSFANYYDTNYLGFRSLRVINEDRVSGGGGFDTHGHRDMEILTYVLEGALKHEDSMGNGSIIKPGDLQRMSAGTGIFHSEFNASSTLGVHFFQVWIFPEEKGLSPSYEQKSFNVAKNPGRLHLIASQNGREDSITVHQNVDLYAGRFADGDRYKHSFNPERHGWLQVASGSVNLNGILLNSGDGAAITNQTDVLIEAQDNAEILLFDLA